MAWASPPRAARRLVWHSARVALGGGGTVFMESIGSCLPRYIRPELAEPVTVESQKKLDARHPSESARPEAPSGSGRVALVAQLRQGRQIASDGQRPAFAVRDDVERPGLLQPLIPAKTLELFHLLRLHRGDRVGRGQLQLETVELGRLAIVLRQAVDSDRQVVGAFQ